jgi:hypothetical protein
MDAAKKKIIGIVLVVVAAVISVVLIVNMVLMNKNASQDSDGQLTTVTGIIGSEKSEFFNDPAVQKIFKQHGLKVEVTTAGSLEMSDKADLTKNDFAFPSSNVSADHLTSAHQSAVKKTFKPFYSPMVIATYLPILNILKTNGVATRSADGIWSINLASYLDLVKKDTRWNQLNDSTGYPSNRSIMITSTDVRTSNSASMYLALSSYVLNGNTVVNETSTAGQQVPTLSKLFLGQGYSEDSSAGPFNDYLSKGMGNAPMVMAYEAQYLEEQMSSSSRITSNMAIAYPDPTIFSDHVLVSFSDAGSKVGSILSTDPAMAKLISKHGFRLNGNNSSAFDTTLKAHRITTYQPSSAFINLAQTPSYEIMTYMLDAIKKEY